jgi:hypothetical protein
MKPAADGGEQQHGIAHDLDFGESPAGEGESIAPAEWIIGSSPVARHAIAAILQVSRIEDFVRRCGI